MNINVSMITVDGRDIGRICNTPKQALDWLTEHDHEGSCVVMSITYDNPEEIYAVLTEGVALGKCES